MSTIYVVMNRREYEGDFPVASFSTHDRAKRWMEWCLGDQGDPHQGLSLYVEDWVLDANLQEMEFTDKHYNLSLRRSGELVWCGRTPHIYYGVTVGTGFKLSPRWTGEGQAYRQSYWVLDCHIWAVDQAAAELLAQTERLRLIEAGEWQEDLI